MADVAPLRDNVQQEAVAFRAAVSEGTFTKMGGAINFINLRQYQNFDYNANGRYSPITGLDGFYVFQFDAEVVGVQMSNTVAGVSGLTEFDILRFTASGGAGASIFSTRPGLAFSEGDNAYFLRDFLNVVDYGTPTAQLPVMTSDPNLFQFTAGDAIRCDIISNQPSAQNASLKIFFRPR